MDEQEYRSTYQSINELRCVFEKAILSRRCACSCCARFHLADREGAACESLSAHQRCSAFLHQLRHNALFALKLTQLQGELPHAKEIKVQTGGLLGLQQILSNEPTADSVDDIAGLLTQALLHHPSLEALPYPRIMQSVVNFEGRKRRPRR